MIEPKVDAPGGDEPTPTAGIIESRFMFVDVAALRAKQLRRGALPRISADHHESIHKLERVAMEEVRRGLVEFSVPPWKRPAPPELP